MQFMGDIGDLGAWFQLFKTSESNETQNIHLSDENSLGCDDSG